MDLEEITKILVENTTLLAKNECKVLAFLIYSNEYVTCREIENATSLRQPEVSVVLSKFYRYDWLKEKILPKQGKGRPIKLVKLSKSNDKIFRFLLQDIEKKIEEYTQRKQKLVKLATNLAKNF